jgi:hypothetical protein
LPRVNGTLRVPLRHTECAVYYRFGIGGRGGGGLWGTAGETTAAGSVLGGGGGAGFVGVRMERSSQPARASPIANAHHAARMLTIAIHLSIVRCPTARGR